MRNLMLVGADAVATGGDEDMDAATQWAKRLPTYGYVKVRELLQL